MHVCMTKVISISDEAYEVLKGFKMGRSFSEVIIEITKEKKKNNLMKFAGVITNKEGEEVKREMYEHRKISSRRFK